MIPHITSWAESAHASKETDLKNDDLATANYLLAKPRSLFSVAESLKLVPNSEVAIARIPNS